MPQEMKRLGVIGWPVAHSRSPAMFEAAFRELGMDDWVYQRLPLAPELLQQTIPALGASGFVGVNVTIPHKQAALALADYASDAARAIGAANTLSFARDGTIEAENTDAPGLVAALGRVECSPKGLSALVLGAGGSARAAVWGLLRGGAREVSVWNRTPERALALAGKLGARAVEEPVYADLLVNCTSVGLQRSATETEALNQLHLSVDLLGKYAYVIDLVYRDGPTPLLATACRVGAVSVDGLEVLAAQGALSFERWTGTRAPIDAMRRAAGLSST
jgi:shikimate dehydrogenase